MSKVSPSMEREREKNVLVGPALTWVISTLSPDAGTLSCHCSSRVVEPFILWWSGSSKTVFISESFRAEAGTTLKI